ncbi:MAG: transaldolase family protein [Nanoarchaeota archaeon]
MQRQRSVLFIDSADPEEISLALSAGFQGVTTNPSLVSKIPKGDASTPFFDRYAGLMNKIAEICNKYRTNSRDFFGGEKPSLSVEVFSNEPNEMIEQANKIKEAINYENLAIKIPISYKDKNYLGVIRHLTSERFNINCTCCFAESQLELAAQAGARYVSLFYNRLIDDFNASHNSSGNGQERALAILRSTRKFLDNNSGINSEIILGSIRYPYDVTNGWENGADIVTAGYKVVPGMTLHPSTDKSVDGFLKDLEGWKK